MSKDQNSHDGGFVGRRARAIRLRHGWTQQLVADRAGLSRGAIAKYESLERPVDSRKTLYALAKALRVNVGDLTGQQDDRLDPAVATAQLNLNSKASRRDFEDRFDGADCW